MKPLSTATTAGVAVGAAVLFNLVAFATSKKCPAPKDVTFFQPPGKVFSTVWPVLYSLLGVVLALLVRSSANKTAPTPWVLATLTLFSLQMALNFSWMPVYSCAQKREAALYILIALLMIQSTTMVAASQVSMPAVTLLCPYTVWLIFALVLNTNSLK